MLELNWNLLYEIINLIVLCLLLKKFLIGPVTGLMEKRRVMIADGLKQAKTSEVQAEAFKKQYEEALLNARNESARLVEEAKKNARTEYERIVDEADGEALAVRKKAEKEIEADKAKAMQDLKSRIAEVALMASGKVLGQSDHSFGDLALYEQFLKEAGENHDAGN